MTNAFLNVVSQPNQNSSVMLTARIGDVLEIEATNLLLRRSAGRLFFLLHDAPLLPKEVVVEGLLLEGRPGGEAMFLPSPDKRLYLKLKVSARKGRSEFRVPVEVDVLNQYTHVWLQVSVEGYADVVRMVIDNTGHAIECYTVHDVKRVGEPVKH